MERRSLKRFGLDGARCRYDVVLGSHKLGLHGIADAILDDGSLIYPVEYKIHGRQPAFSQIMQLIAYGVLAEEEYGLECKRGFLLFGDKGKTHPVAVDDEKRERLLKILEEIRENLDGGIPFSPASIHQCTQCEFLNLCNDRE